jgi:hypothetical protein
VPPSRDDRRLLVFTGVIVALAAVMVALLLLAATGGGGTPKTAPLFLGLRGPLVSEIKKGGPNYIANPFGDNGFWLDLEGGQLVALVLDRPGQPGCHVKWKRTAYFDCHGDTLSSRDLDRYEVTVGPRHGSPRTSVFVLLNKVMPAPGTAGTS